MPPRGGQRDTHRLIDRSRAWNGTIGDSELDKLCGDLFTSVNQPAEEDALRSAASTLLAHDARLPTLHRATCEFVLAWTQELVPREANVHLRTAWELIHVLKMAQRDHGLVDPRVDALETKVNRLERMLGAENARAPRPRPAAERSATTMSSQGGGGQARVATIPQQLPPPPATEGPATMMSSQGRGGGQAWGAVAGQEVVIPVKTFYERSCVVEHGHMNQLRHSEESHGLLLYVNGYQQTVGTGGRIVGVGLCYRDACHIYYCQGSNKVLITYLEETPYSNGSYVCIELVDGNAVRAFLNVLRSNNTPARFRDWDIETLEPEFVFRRDQILRARQ